MKDLRFTYFVKILLLAAFVFTALQSIEAQKMSRIEKDKMKSILNNIKNDIKKYYYDPNYRGINVDERFAKAEERINQVDTLDQVYGVIAQALLDFDDSHLFFSPPETNYDVEYGVKMKTIGAKTFVTAVKPKSDADKKGLKIGDEILVFESFKPTRKDLWKMQYYYNVLSPKTKLRFKVLRPNSAEPVDIEFESKVTEKKRFINTWDSIDVNEEIRRSEDYYNRKTNYFATVGGTVVWKMRTFSFDPLQVDQVMNEATKASSLIIDLRGNGGGLVKNLEAIAAYFFDKDIKIADRSGREGKKKENQPMMAEKKSKKTFGGKVVILIDSQSASASEVLSRFMQLEKRAVILGDVSAGAVMQAIGKGGVIGANNLVFYGVSITNADVIMADGKSIEHVGVTPDEIVLPTAEDLANRRDPVLARAFELVGNKISAQEAGKIFPDDEWDK